MATVRDIATGALRRIDVLDISEEADAEMVAVAVDAYNGLMMEAKAAGWIAAFTVQALGDTITLGDEQIEPLKAAVGERIAADFGRAPSPMVMRGARMFHAQIAAAGYTPQTFERGFRYEDPDNEHSADAE